MEEKRTIGQLIDECRWDNNVRTSSLWESKEDSLFRAILFNIRDIVIDNNEDLNMKIMDQFNNNEEIRKLWIKQKEKK